MNNENEIALQKLARHQMITLLYRDFQRMLGHEKLDTTKIYLDLDDRGLRYQHEKFL